MGGNSMRKFSRELLSSLQDVVGPQNIIDRPIELKNYSHDAVYQGNLPDIVVQPKCTEDVAEIMCIANKYQTPVTPRGAGTGLTGGAVPIHGGIVLSLEQMNKILAIDLSTN